MTFSQTEAILENAEVNGVSPKDIAKVFRLRDGWEYVLNNLDNEVNLGMLEELHQIVAREDVPWERLGVLRDEAVRISGTNYLPELPDAEKVYREIREILSGDGSDTDMAVSLVLYVMRAQLFLDGNKRVATLICNKILIERGRGIFSLPPEAKEEFGKLLVKFYESGEADEIKKFIFKKCLSGY
ncbi:MAG: Fic family protein [Candidatus Saccharibacteria bacterium]|nr:Fic family protein [Candidatus Saccharibacteria bacterium]